MWGRFHAINQFIMNKKKYTTESIRARMLSRVATLWDIRSIDLIDPAAKMLVEALASEIFMLSGEMEDSQDRIVEKLAGAFTPPWMTAASPAHAVIHARSVEPSVEIDADTEFLYKDPHFLRKHNLQKLAFTPIGRAPLVNGDVACMISGGKIYNMSCRQGKEHVINSIGRSVAFNHGAWIGLDIADSPEPLKNIAFYFTFPLMDSCEEYLKLLRYGKWFLDGQSLRTAPGLKAACLQEGAVFEEFDLQRHLYGEIISKYNAHFITLDDDISVKQLKRETVPSELAGEFDEASLKGLRDDLVWIKIVFPPSFDENALEYLHVHINCFPAANMYRHQATSAVTKISSILPIEKGDDEYFLFMDSVTDTMNREYRQVLTHDDDTPAGTYMIRRGGSERFNAQNAKDFLERLLELLREQSVAFSAIDREIAGTIHNFTADLLEFEQLLNAYGNDTEQMSYLILDTDIKTHTGITMRYFLTNGVKGNHIRALETLETSKASDISTQSVMLMTSPRGGVKSPSEASRRDIFRYLLITRDRIHTGEDIKLFCRSFYGDAFNEVRVESGYEVSNIPKQGIIRVTKVILDGVRKNPGMETELLRRDVLVGLERRSPEERTYRIIIS
jgi:hypothetical protein